MWYDSTMTRIAATAVMMSFFPALLALSITGCQPKPVPIACRTTCGLELVGEVPPLTDLYPGARGWSCDEFQLAEDVTISAFERMVDTNADPRFLNSCGALSGVEVQVRPMNTWVDPANPDAGADVAGWDFCDQGFIQVNDAPPMESSLPHELAHAIQNCNATAPVRKSDPDHSNWGIYKDEDGGIGIERAIQFVWHQETIRYWSNPSCYGHDAGSYGYIGPTDGGTCF